MLQIGWGTLAAQAGLKINTIPATQEHLDRLTWAACELVERYEENELNLIGPGPVGAYMAIAVALAKHGRLKTLTYTGPDLVLRIF